MIGRAWTLRECAAVMRGKVDDRFAESTFRGVCTDSREIEPGELFVALRGPQFDGHAFVRATHAGGAAGAVVQDTTDIPAAVPVVVVQDTLAALGDLAAAVLVDRAIPVVGITGSCGKTAVKEMTAAILGADRPVGATPGNLNNLIGVPLSVFRLPELCEVAVLELATSAPGEIRRLSEIVRPRVAVITNVAPAHLEGLHTLDGVREAKAEILAGLSPEGTLVLNADDPSTEVIKSRFGGRVYTFGFGESADVRGTNLRFDTAHHSHFRVNDAWDVELRIYGRAAVANALAAITVGTTFGLEPDLMARALAGVAPTPMRMEIRERGGVWLINDAYNANPRSMAAALSAFENGSFTGRKIAVLGDMLELGDAAAVEHEALGRLVGERGAHLVYLLGTYAPAVRAGALAAGLQPECVYTMETHEAIVTSLRYVLQPEDVVLVKGSRGARMERVVSGLWEALA